MKLKRNENGFLTGELCSQNEAGGGWLFAGWCLLIIFSSSYAVWQWDKDRHVITVYDRFNGIIDENSRQQPFLYMEPRGDGRTWQYHFDNFKKGI